MDDRDKSKEELIAELIEFRHKATLYNGLKENIYDFRRMMTLHGREVSLILDNLPVYIFIKDIDGTILEANQKICDAMGLPRKDVIGKTTSDLFPPDIAEKYISNDLQLFKSGNTMIRDEEFFDKGRKVIVETRRLPLTDDDGVLIGLMGIAYDITDRKRIENALRDSEKFLSNVFDCIQDGISILDKDLNIVRTNHVLEEWHPYMMPIVGKKCYFAYHTRSEPCVVCPSIMAMREKKMKKDFVPFSGEAGQRGWLEIYSYPIKDDAGNVVGVVEHVRDITERKRIEESLQRSEEKYRSLVEKINDLVWETDENSAFIYVSPNVREIFDMGPEDVLGKKPYDFLTPDELKRVQATLKPVVIDRKPICLCHVHYSKGGRCKYIEFNGTPKFDENGAFRGYRGTARDITDRKLVEKELAESKARAELYVDLMAHDINNMNQITMGFLELAQNIIEYEGRLSPDNIYLLDKARESLNNSTRLIDSVRKLQREKMGFYEPKVLDIDTVLSDVIPNFRNVPNRVVHINYSPAPGFEVMANDLLPEIFINLIGNAIKHSTGPLEVDIHTDKAVEAGKEYIRVTVDDDGPGIPDDVKNILFDRWNLDNTRARGKGFGICLIQMLVDDYGGRLRVEDRIPGDFKKGTRFVVLLPAAGKCS